MHAGIIGGTGHEGRGVAARLASAGVPVLVGSRQLERAQETVAALGTALPLGAATNEQVASDCDVVFLAVPFSGVAELLEAFRTRFRPGALVIDLTVPLTFDRGVPAIADVAEGSATEFIRARLPAEVRLAAAFKTIPASALAKIDTLLDCDEFVCGDTPEVSAAAIDLLSRIPSLRLLDAGGLRSARLIERMTALAIVLNKRYKVRGARFKVVGM
ncbi:MAG TPA: NADPH-dependent F420 reductase [Vicinamibacterales bacterium]|nr:NADPH-dependent F420 reductase [Vicinamibacterales bacterium]